MPDEFDDPILPEGFDPETFTGFNEETTPESSESTPEQQQTETDGSVTTPDGSEQPSGEQAEASSEEPTTTLEQELSAIPPTPQTVKIKFNHEEREIGVDEAATLAQKGMNYDKLSERLKAIEAANARNEKLAKHLGYKSSLEMIEAAEQNFINREVNKLIEAGNTEAMAKFLVEQQMAKAADVAPAQESQPQEEPTPEQPEQPVINTQRKQELDEFVRAYPGITKLPEEVIAANQKGVRLLVAYERFKNKAALEELAILKQNQAAAAKAPVTGVTGKASPDKPEVDDPFLKGFDNAY